MTNKWGPWFGWNGGECPVDPEDEVAIVTFDGHMSDKAGLFSWGHTGGQGDILAYRVKKKPAVYTKWLHVVMTTSAGTDYMAVEGTYTDGELTKIHWEKEE